MITISEILNQNLFGVPIEKLIMFFIILTTASTLHVNGINNIETADQAARALMPFAGEFAFILFALGIIGTGLLAVPILAGSASYAISEAFNWKTGLNRKFSQARSFYLIIAISTILGLVVNFLPIKPFQMLYFAAIINGLCAPFLLLLILKIASNKNIMGNNTNPWISNIMGWVIFLIMGASAIFLLASNIL